MKNIIIIAVVLLCFSCPRTRQMETGNTQNDDISMSETIFDSKKIIDSISIEKLLSLLETYIDSIPTIECFAIKPIVIEDEGIRWNGLNYLDSNGNIGFCIESNWQDKLLVHRITIYSNEIKYGELLYVGQTFGNIKHILDDKIPTASDGYLYVIVKEEPSIRVQIDISNIPVDSPLYYGGFNSIVEIPDSLTVGAIILM